MFGIKSFFFGDTKFIILQQENKENKQTVFLTHLVGEKHDLIVDN